MVDKPSCRCWKRFFFNKRTWLKFDDTTKCPELRTLNQVESKNYTRYNFLLIKNLIQTAQALFIYTDRHEIWETLHN